MSECLFCRIIAGKIPATIVYSDNRIIAFKDIEPQAPHHIIIIPRKHFSTIQDLSNDDANLIGNITLVANQIAEELGIAENGYRLIWNCNHDGGQAVYHIHLHLLGGRVLKLPLG
jgi:histidine triad (HIT) family protein